MRVIVLLWVLMGMAEIGWGQRVFRDTSIRYSDTFYYDSELKDYRSVSDIRENDTVIELFYKYPIISNANLRIQCSWLTYSVYNEHLNKKYNFQNMLFGIGTRIKNLELGAYYITPVNTPSSMSGMLRDIEDSEFLEVTGAAVDGFLFPITYNFYFPKSKIGLVPSLGLNYTRLNLSNFRIDKLVSKSIYAELNLVKAFQVSEGTFIGLFGGCQFVQNIWGGFDPNLRNSNTFLNFGIYLFGYFPKDYYAPIPKEKNPLRLQKME